jgi:3-phosphoshikimate 1-carboxyvinyltransferase
MGALIHETVDFNGPEPYGTLLVEKGGRLKATVVGGAEIPNVIDELPILAVAFALAEGVSEIRNAEELRVKETDRIAAVAGNLRKFGVPVEERPDGMIIEGGHPITAATVDSFGDHRIAMAFSILGLFAKGTTKILNTDCIATSYPTFEKHLAEVVRGPSKAPRK